MIKFNVKRVRIGKYRFNNSYRRYVCKSNKNAGSASWPRSGRACERKLYKTKIYILGKVFDIKEFGNHQKVGSYDIKVSIAASET